MKYKFLRTIILSTLGSLSIVEQAYADTHPCSDKECIIFITDSLINGGQRLSGMDNLCNTEGVKRFNANLTYKALLATNRATKYGVNYYRPDGTFIATASGPNLAGILANPIAVNSTPGTSEMIWTGMSNGHTYINDYDHDCKGWSETHHSSTYHDYADWQLYTKAGYDWNEGGDHEYCANVHRLACVAQ